jgi:hypothetical protein
VDDEVLQTDRTDVDAAVGRQARRSAPTSPRTVTLAVCPSRRLSSTSRPELRSSTASAGPVNLGPLARRASVSSATTSRPRSRTTTYSTTLATSSTRCEAMTTVRGWAA